jgi:Ni/Co efflux regulator RcnB
MHRGYRYLSSLFLTAALAAPVALMAAASPQDNRNQENRQGENNKENRQRENNKRYYDKSHKDYHTWDSNEDRSYQRYQTERHQKRAFVQLSTRQQTVYWNWRHSNPDNR